MKTLQNGGKGLHVELRNTKDRVKSTEVENGAELTSLLGQQEVVGVAPPPHPGSAASRHTPTLTRMDETYSHKASHLNCSIGNGIAKEVSAKGGLLAKGKEYPCLTISRTNWSEVICSLAGRKKREPAAHREGAYLGQTKLIIPYTHMIHGSEGPDRLTHPHSPP